MSSYFYRSPADTPLTASDVSKAALLWPQKARRSRRWALAAAVLAVPVTAALLLYLSPSVSARLWPEVDHRNIGAIEKAIHPAPRPQRPPPSDEREHGLWRPRMPPWTQEDMRRLYNGFYQFTERLPEASTAQTEEEREKEERARAVALANWQWVPGLNASLERDWDWRKWAVRSLRSTGGVVVVGDSIHLQLFHHLRSLLPSSFDLTEDFARVYGFQDPNSVQPAYLNVFLREDDAHAAELLKLAKVPATRLQRPVLSYIRDDLLMSVGDVARLRDAAVRAVSDDGDAFASPEDVQNAWKEFTSRIDDFDSTKEGQDGVTNVVIGGWRPRVDKLLEPIGAWAGTEKTILVINTGAHWSGPCLPEIGEARLQRTYKGMVDIVAPQLVDLSSKAAVLFRPTVPGHPNCETATAPFASETEGNAMLAELDFFADMAWGTFPSYNLMWRTAFAALHAEVGWLPVFTRSLLRPDAHRLGGDCLHVEGGSLLAEWGAEVWRVLYELEGDRVPDV
ncbi:hypothetical protein AURDEDRAFT_172812 [Auricularia subglabra TFB-10046 SS5]|nr:hypothetical protein AURDEDRAFT_172812 [Auricularia subglabra TFB-10046 SS5]